MKQALYRKEYLPFYVLYSLFLLLGGIFLLSYSREDSHLILNQFFYTPFHHFFQTITYLGDGLIPVVLVFIALFSNYKMAIQVALTSILAGGATQLLKNYVFDEVNRPSFHFKYFSENSIQTIEGMDLNIHNSFPSGHTTTAFAVYVSLLLLARNTKLTFAFAMVALLAGYSRVYLSEHFFIDIYAGSLMGTFWALVVFAFLNINEKSWFSKSLLRR